MGMSFPEFYCIDNFLVKSKASEMRKKTKEELLKELEQLRSELHKLRVAQVTGGTPAKLAQINEFRKSIAVVLTVYNQTQKTKLRQDFKNKALKPLDLRRKLTRAFRKRLAPKYAAAMKVRAQKRAAYFPQRVFAIKA